MIELFRDAQEFGHFTMRRAITFAAALFINQGHYDKALDLLNNCYQQNYVTIRNLKVIALSKTQRLSDAFTILRICVDYDTPEARKRSVYKEVVRLLNSITIRNRLCLHMQIAQLVFFMSKLLKLIYSCLVLCKLIQFKEAHLSEFERSSHFIPSNAFFLLGGGSA